MPAMTRKTTTTPTASPETTATPGGWLTDELRVDLRRAAIPLDHLDQPDSPWYVTDEARPFYGRTGTVTSIAGLVEFYSSTARSEPNERNDRHTHPATEERLLWTQADRLRWPEARSSAEHVRAGRLTPGGWLAWTVHAKLLRDATTAAAEHTRKTGERDRRAQAHRQRHTCTICGQVDYATTQPRRILDPTTLDDPATTPRSGRDVQCCRPCHDAIRQHQAQAKHDAARAWLTGARGA